MKIRIFIWLTLAILCMGYGLCVMAVQSGSPFFVVWLVLGVFCIIAAIAAKCGWRKKFPRWLRRICAVFTLCVALVFCVVEGFVVSGFGETGQDGLDYVVVLGAQVYAGGPSPVLRYRLDAAYDYLVKNPETKCIVSGGQGFNEPFPEADGMCEYLVARGIGRERIFLERQSGNTIENIRFSMVYLNDKETDKVGIISNNFHVFRAVGIARKQGILHTEGIAAKTNPFYIPNNMFREFFGVLKDTLLGNMKWGA